MKEVVFFHLERHASAQREDSKSHRDAWIPAADNPEMQVEKHRREYSGAESAGRRYDPPMKRLALPAALFVFAIACGEKERPVAQLEQAPAPPAAAETIATESVASAGTQPEVVPENAAPADITGAYFAMAPLPAEFAELDHLLLALIDDNGEPAPLNGFLRPKAASAKDYALRNPSLNGKTLTFTTVPVNDVAYAFTGAFTTLDNFAVNTPSYDTAILTGTLTKMRGTQQVASTPVRFRYVAGD
jgi:hypothetical protein